MNEVAAILLAAGQSRRMGSFKPLLPFGPSTVIESCIDNLRLGGVEQIVVVVSHRADEIVRQLKVANVSCVLNRDTDSEMSASIACGIGQLDPSVQAVLVALSDQPAIPAAVVRSLVTQWRQGAKVVKPEYEGHGGHPVLIDLGFRNELLNLDPQGGLKAFFDNHKSEVCRLAVDSPFIARDMDTWDDYVSLHQEVFGFGPNLQVGGPN
jgi:CTP:molybdopterin cytidylyltransferase MocA